MHLTNPHVTIGPHAPLPTSQLLLSAYSMLAPLLAAHSLSRHLLLLTLLAVSSKPSLSAPNAMPPAGDTFPIPRSHDPNSIPDAITGTNLNPNSAASPAAPAATNYPNPPISFDPRPCYARVVALLASRLDHTQRFASEQDDNLACLYPGIEPWLAEHGHLFDWHKEWATLTAS